MVSDSGVVGIETMVRAAELLCWLEGRPVCLLWEYGR